MNHYSEKVIGSFFQPFYSARISNARQAASQYRSILDLGLLNFWFSVVDFYGGIYYLGVEGKQTDRHQEIKLATPRSFEKFIRDFFPEPENSLGKFIYAIFRSGITHQVSPKKRRNVWQPENPRLLWIEVDGSQPNPDKNKTAMLNIPKFAQLTYEAYLELKRQIENDEIVPVCEQITRELIAPYDAFLDERKLNEQIALLDEAFREQLFVNK